MILNLFSLSFQSFKTQAVRKKIYLLSRNIKMDGDGDSESLCKDQKTLISSERGELIQLSKGRRRRRYKF